MLKTLSFVIGAVRRIGFRTTIQALLYSLRRPINDARFAQPSVHGGTWLTPGQVESVETNGPVVTLHCTNASIRIEACAPDIFRVRLRPDGDFPTPFSYAIAKTDWEPIPVEVGQDVDHISIKTGRLICKVSRDDTEIAFETPDGKLLSTDKAPMAWREDGSVAVHRSLQSGESCHGLGQRAFGLNLRGRRYMLWNCDPANYDRGDDPVYYSIPFYLGILADGTAYGLFFDNSHRGYADLGAARKGRLTVSFEQGELRYYFFGGGTVEDVLRRYTELTGRIGMPPLWALGYQQSRWSYIPDSKVREIANEFRRRKIPCDVIYLDIDYMDDFRCFTWDRRKFPDLPGLLSELHEKGFHVVTIIDPGIKVDRDYPVYKSGIERDVFLKYPDGTLFTAPVWPGNCHFPDFTSPDVREWWAEQFTELIGAGVDGIWNDMCEPVIFALEGGTCPTIPDYVQHDLEGKGGSHAEAHNVYGMLMGRATLTALDRLRPGRRQLCIVRAAYAGAQRYVSSWTGDNRSTWDHLRLSVSMVLNLGLSGMAFTGPDVGGFDGIADGEMFVRWVQLGAFLPFFRAHKISLTPPHEPWSFGQPYEDMCRNAIETRYRLMPYLYTCFAMAATEGLPIVRPIFMLDPDPVWREIDDQFMFGPDLMIAPILDPGRSERGVRLPPGIWYDYRDGRRYEGGRSIIVDAPLNVIPVFAMAGSVVPEWPVMQYAGERRVDTLTLRVFTGNGESRMYEDDGDGPTNPEGWSHFRVRRTDKGLQIRWERPEGHSPTYDKIRVIVYGLDARPSAVTVDGQAAGEWRWTGELLEIKTAPFGNITVSAK